MYLYHALINALTAHTVHIPLNTIFYIHVEHSPTRTIYIRYYMHTHTHTHDDYSRNWVLILVGVEILSFLEPGDQDKGGTQSCNAVACRSRASSPLTNFVSASNCYCADFLVCR